MRYVMVVMLAVLMAMPAMAKVNVSGVVFTTYWAQQQGTDISYQQATATGWRDAGTQAGGALYRGTAPSASYKTFLMGNNMMGNGLTAHATAGYGFCVAFDCPVSDEIKAYARFTSNSANLNLAARHIWIAYMPMTELNFRIGRFPIPFGHEGTCRPTEKVREIFISEYTQNAGGALNSNYDIGVMAYGSLLDNTLEYKLYTGNGVVRTVADSAGMVAASATAAQPDNNDAKQGVLNLKFKPFTGAFVGGAYALGDFTNTNNINGVSVQRSRATAYDLNAGYEMSNVFRVSGEYATTRHDKMALEGDAYVIGPAARNQLTSNRVNEYIVKATYLGVADWEFGVRYSVIDPKNFEAELAAGLSRESKISFALGYKFAGSAQLNAEYSRVNTDLNYLNSYDAALIAGDGGNIYRVNPCEDPFDDIYALQLGLQF